VAKGPHTGCILCQATQYLSCLAAQSSCLRRESNNEQRSDDNLINVYVVLWCAVLCCVLLQGPVSGSKKPAIDGQLIILAAGDEGLCEDCETAFDIMVRACTAWCVSEWVEGSQAIHMQLMEHCNRPRHTQSCV